LIFDYGVDNIGADIDFLFDLRTDQGELKAGAAEAVRWSGGAGAEITPKALVEFIKAQGKEELFKQAKKSYNLTGAKGITEWIAKDPELQTAFETLFGVMMKREDLIMWIEKNARQQDLTDAVRAKWERIEQEIRTSRQRKYE